MREIDSKLELYFNRHENWRAQEVRNTDKVQELEKKKTKKQKSKQTNKTLVSYPPRKIHSEYCGAGGVSFNTSLLLPLKPLKCPNIKDSAMWIRSCHNSEDPSSSSIIL